MWLLAMQRFNPDVQRGGVLANTQAGKLPLYELDQVIENRLDNLNRAISYIDGNPISGAQG